MKTTNIPYAEGGYQAKRTIGIVERFYDDLLNEQAEWVKGMEIKVVAKSLEDLPPKTKEQELEMAWDEGLML